MALMMNRLYLPHRANFLKKHISGINFSFIRWQNLDVGLVLPGGPAEQSCIFHLILSPENGYTTHGPISETL
jgi:hypothetical protein